MNVIELKRIARSFASVILIYPFVSMAGYFDCSVIYDEFDSLMNKQYLIEPDRYVQVQKGRMNRMEFLSLQQGRLHLNTDRKNYGVVIFRTNQNVRGKLLFNWNVEKINGQPPILFQESILYGRVYDGYAPQQLRPTMIKPTYFIDIDTGAVTEETKEADIAYRDSEGEFFLEAVNGAEINFPVESLCHVIQSDVIPEAKNVQRHPTENLGPNIQPTTTISTVPDEAPAADIGVIPGLRGERSGRTTP